MNDKNDWFKHLQSVGESLWVNEEQERKDSKNAKIMGWGLGMGAGLWFVFWRGGDGFTGFILFMVCWIGSYMLTED